MNASNKKIRKVMNDSSKHAAQNPVERYSNNLDVKMCFELKFDVAPVNAVPGLYCQRMQLQTTTALCIGDATYYTVATLITSR